MALKDPEHCVQLYDASDDYLPLLIVVSTGEACFDIASSGNTINRAMSSFWWVPETFGIVDRPEISYCIDPKGDFNYVSRIEAEDKDLPLLVAEIAERFRDINYKVFTYSYQSKKLFALLDRAGFQSENEHNILFQYIQNHGFRKWPNFLIEKVQSKEQLIALEKSSAQIFRKRFQLRSDDEYHHMLKEYHQEKPRAMRFLARDIASKEVLGSASMSLFPELKVVTFFGGCTIPSERKKGVYSALIDARMEYAKQRGLEIAAVYARKTTSSPIVKKQGFHHCGEMTYWVRKANFAQSFRRR